MTGTRPSGLTPHLFARDAQGAVAFYIEAFGACELVRNRRLLLSEETPGLDALAPPSIGGTPLLLHLEVDDVDTVIERAVQAGAQVEMPVREMFWGEPPEVP